MKNQDMPANPCTICGPDKQQSDVFEYEGETKREKAFWQVYSALLSSPNTTSVNEADIASVAMAVVDEGFKALSENDQ